MKRLQAILMTAMSAHFAAVCPADEFQPAMDHFTRLAPSAEPVKPLFVSASTALDRDANRNDVIRKRPVRIDRALFETIDPDANSRFLLNLFDDVQYEAIVSNSVVRGPESYTCFGKLAGLAMADFMMVVEADVVLLRVSDYENNRYFELRSVSDEPTFAYEVSNYQPDECAGPVTPEPLPSDESTSRAAARCSGQPGPADVGDRFDILVVYTHYARDAQGGDAAMQALAFQAANDMNQRLANSNLYHRVRIVATRLVDYGESGAASTDLENLQLSTDPYMNDVHAWRAEVAADLVVLIVDTLDNGGLAYRPVGAIGVPTCSYGFAVVRRTAIGGGTFAHELGHTFGNCHSAEEGGCDDPINGYCRGYRFTCGAVRWHTTLASDGHDSWSRRIPYYSTPAVDYNCDLHGGGRDEPVGSSSANAASTIYDFSYAVANNYLGDFNCYVSGLASGGQVGSAQFPYHFVRLAIDDRPAGTTVNISAGTYPERGVFSKPVTLTAYDGNAVIQ